GAEKAFVITAGASQLCKLMIAVAKDEGFRPIAIVRRDSQIEMLKQAGATHVLNCESDGFAADMQAVMKAEKPRIFLDAVANGISSTIFTAMPRKARWIIYGKLDDEMPVLQEPGQMIFMMKQIEGFWLTRWMTEKPMADK
ncbi:MAG: zinc-binding dehydrogenase, partial [Pseudomonadota bacterium]